MMAIRLGSSSRRRRTTLGGLRREGRAISRIMRAERSSEADVGINLSRDTGEQSLEGISMFQGHFDGRWENEHDSGLYRLRFRNLRVMI